MKLQSALVLIIVNSIRQDNDIAIGGHLSWVSFLFKQKPENVFMAGECSTTLKSTAVYFVSGSSLIWPESVGPRVFGWERTAPRPIFVVVPLYHDLVFICPLSLPISERCTYT